MGQKIQSLLIYYKQMSIKKTGARLWFESEEETAAYDELMVSNIELKSPDFDDPNFTILSVRPKKEILPGTFSSRFYADISKVLGQQIGKSQIRIAEHGKMAGMSLLTDQMEFVKKTKLNWAIGYLVLRELPIRNFYARSIILTLFMGRYFAVYGLPYATGWWNSPGPYMGVHRQHDKDRKLFDWIRLTDQSIQIPLHGQGM